MKKITLLLNEQENKISLVEYASALAKDLNYEVNYLYIQTPQILSTDPDFITPTVMDLNEMNVITEISNDMIDKLTQTLISKGYIKNKTDIDYEIGDAYTIVQEKIQKGDTDVIILPVSNQLSFWNLNQASIDIIKHITCPVLIINADMKYVKFSTILYASDFLEEDIATIKRLVNMGSYNIRSIEVLHIEQNKTFRTHLTGLGFQSMLKDSFKSSNIDIQVHSIPYKESISNGVLVDSEAKTTNADIIVVLKENKSFFASIFSKSFTNSLIKETHLPILIFHHK
ncbi:MAG: hypothetical protein ACRCXN_04970 [Bacteroidales bacterium]